MEEIERPVEIHLENVSKVYESGGKEVTALTNVTLDIYKGEFIALLGPSGCGKTTLLRIVANLHDASGGVVEIEGMTPKEARLQRKYGMVFQSPVLYEWRSIIKNIEMPLEMMKIKKEVTDKSGNVKEKYVKISKEERKQTAEAMLDLVGLKNFANHYPSQLSGGMQQRVGIARAFAIKPEILLMDEPFSALDEFTKEKLHEDLLRIWRKTNKTVLFVTHNIQEAVYLADRICVLSPHPGRLSAVVDVNLPRPRTMEMKSSKEFNDLVVKVRNSFEGV